MQSSWTAGIGDRLADAQWFQELRAKWEELDPRSRLYLKVAAIAVAVALASGVFLTFAWNGYQAKAEFDEKSLLVNSIQKAADELRELKASGVAIPSAKGGNWTETINTIASQSGMDIAEITIAPEKPGKSNQGLKESMIDIHVKKTNIRQVVKFAYNLENSGQPIKIRNLSIDTLGAEGFLETKVSVSAFSGQ